jgi:hypothetical protein
MGKKLNFKQIETQVSQYSKKQKVTLSDGNYVNIYPNFSPTKVQNMVKEIMSDQIRAEKAGIDFSSIKIDDWGFFNIIKSFCDLDIPSEIEKKVQAFTTLVESDYFTEIISAFPQESLQKVIKALDQTTQNLNTFNALSEEEKEKLTASMKLQSEENIVQ